MSGQIRLYKLVDLALCDPEVGAVNFNHLRTLLISILKLTNTTDTFVEQVDATSANNIIINNNIDLSIDHSDASESSLQRDTPVNLDESKEKTIYVNTALLNQKKLENRIINLEKCLKANEVFPSNDAILNDDRNDEEVNTIKREDDSIEMDVSRLRTIWQNKKSLRRLHGVEEAIDKLFSLLNDMLSKDKSNASKDEYEKMENQIADIQNRLDKFSSDTSNNRNEIQNSTAVMEDLANKIKHINELVNENMTKNANNDENIEYMKTQIKGYKEHKSKGDDIKNQISDLEENMNKLMEKLDEKVDVCELEKKLDNSELHKGGNVIDIEVIQTEVTRLTEEVSGIQEQMANLAPSSLETVNQLREQLDTYISKTDSSLDGFEKDLANIHQSVANIDDDKLKQMFDNVEGLTSITNGNEEIDAMKTTIGDILTQLERTQKLQNEMEEKLDASETVLNSVHQSHFTTPEIDTSVLAAIQHLAQENRQQITAIQESIKLLQKLQMPVLQADDGNGSDSINVEMFELLQNHILTLQQEQVKQSGHISNMVEDYKAEFSRKQLHIDALYDYIEKLQHDKANREDVYTVEMNIKADKQSLDNKVSMTTFDERYHMLEEALQHTLARLDQYVEEEASLKDALTKLSDDMSGKMDSDAGKQLRKFLDERLKAIQVSRTHLPDGRDILDTGAGLRRPMSMHYNCLSCDRSIDVAMRGIIPAVPYNLPSRTPLASGKQEKRVSLSSYNSMAANRPCGGSHTSVNVNSLRMMKVNPLLNSGEYNNPTAKQASGNDATIIDGVIGRDGQIYRGRHRSQEIFAPNPKQSDRNSARSKPRAIHSARISTKATDIPKSVDRPHSVMLAENKEENEDPFYLPLLKDIVNGHKS